MRLDAHALQPVMRVNQEPYKGVPHSVELMRRAARVGQAHPKVRAHALSVVRGVMPRDHLSEMAALYYDACRRIRYTRDPVNVELIQHPAVTLQQRAGDCDDVSVLLGACAMALGNEAQYVTVGFDPRASGDQRFTHVFLRVQAPDGSWLVLDPVAGPHSGTMLRRAAHYKTYPAS